MAVWTNQRQRRNSKKQMLLSVNATICCAVIAENDLQVSKFADLILSEIMLMDLTGSAEDQTYNVFDA